MKSMKISPSNRGVALVIVLGFLVLLSGLAIAFFSSVTTELTASRTYSSNVSTRQLADSAVSVVMGQIRDATARRAGAWASQPGMIRVYRSGNTVPDDHSPMADAFFKLYSARNMVVTAGDLSGFDPGAEPSPYASDRNGEKGDAPSDWNDYPALFTDLNSPVMVSDPASPASDPRPVFPIIDPRAYAKATNDPYTQDPKNVEGFWYDSGSSIAGIEGPSAGADKQRLPMPVRWIYVLRDGTLTTPNKDSKPTEGGTGAEWTTSDYKTPTKENPVVGRIAFWTDDDTSKININTAGGFGLQAAGGYDSNYNIDSYAGTFWDTPRVYTNFDIGQTNPADGTLLPNVPGGPGGLAACQPFQKEFQRYPGHPATTSLGAAFASLLTSEQIYKLTPRLNGGGSVGGTIRTEKAVATELTIKTERLYASLDELLFSETPTNGGQRETNDKYLGASNVITTETLEKLKFFLTPHSRAPDLNLYGRPRVAIWPVNDAPLDEATGRNVFDRAIAFCSTIGGKKFIFTRATKGVGALSTEVDIAGGSAASRNVAILEYLRELTSQKIPGFGGTFEKKYTQANRDALLGQIFDYIRIANLRDTTKGMITYEYAPNGIVAPSRSDIFGTGKIGGFGRFPTISEASIVFYCAGVKVHPGTRQPPDGDNPTGKVIENPDFYQGLIHDEDLANDKIKSRYVRAFLILSTFHPMQGYAPIVSPNRLANDQVVPVGQSGSARRLKEAEKIVFEVTGLDQFLLNDQNMGFPGTAENKLDVTSGDTHGGRNYGGYEGFFHTLHGHGAINDEEKKYKFLSAEPGIEVAADATGFKFTGGKITVKIKLNQQPTEIQTIELDFKGSASDWPVPLRRYRVDGYGSFARDPESTSVLAANFNAGATIEMAQNLLDMPDGGPGRISWCQRHNANPSVNPNEPFSGNNTYGGNRFRQIIQPGDVVRSLIYGTYKTASNTSLYQRTKTGDLRMLALTETVPNTAFTPHPDYYDSAYRFAQGLRSGNGSVYIYATGAPGYWDIDALPHKGPAFTEATAFGNHINHGTFRADASRAAQLPFSRTPGNGGVNGVARFDGQPGDFDTGMGAFPDGPYAGKQDEGNVIYKYFDNEQQKWIYPLPYSPTFAYEPPGDIFFSPNRQMPSAVLFGSLLPRSKDPNRQWETLAFCPNTVGPQHPGNTDPRNTDPMNPVAPRDHLLLDLFTMPFVEPYLISEPLSTAGRVNLNYQIAPFSYIQRSTALRAALHPMRVTAIRTALFNGSQYKIGKNGQPLSAAADNARLRINRDETIKAIDSYFSHYKDKDTGTIYPEKGFFKSASQICERFLYPVGPGIAPTFDSPTYEPDDKYDPPGGLTGEASIITFWGDRTLTGDNAREKPYADLYPRITTKSNTYTVHMRVQTVRQIGTDGDFKKWREGKDVVLGEYRGATTIERYIDPSDRRFDKNNDETRRLDDFIDVTAATYDSSKPQTRSLEDIYRFRVVGTKRFAP